MAIRLSSQSRNSCTCLFFYWYQWVQRVNSSPHGHCGIMVHNTVFNSKPTLSSMHNLSHFDLILCSSTATVFLALLVTRTPGHCQPWIFKVLSLIATECTEDF